MCSFNKFYVIKFLFFWSFTWIKDISKILLIVNFSGRIHFPAVFIFRPSWFVDLFRNLMMCRRSITYLKMYQFLNRSSQSCVTVHYFHMNYYSLRSLPLNRVIVIVFIKCIHLYSQFPYILISSLYFLFLLNILVWSLCTMTVGDCRVTLTSRKVA